MRIEIPVSLGELVDKITILEIKREALREIGDEMKLALVLEEWSRLTAVLRRSFRKLGLYDDEALRVDREILTDVNQKLWQVEDKLREHERRQDFGPRFVELARAVYLWNDRRALVKKEINERAGSDLVEVKVYGR